MVTAILKALDLLEKLSGLGQLICLGGHPHFRLPVTLVSLVSLIFVRLSISCLT